jgi:hypothetical protein
MSAQRWNTPPPRPYQQVPGWADYTLHSISRDEYAQIKRFLIRRHHSSQGLVAFKDIQRFVARQGAFQVSWGSLVRSCTKPGSVQPGWLQADYWLNPALKDAMSYVLLDGRLLVSRGMLKTALARYALHQSGADTLYGVRVSRWSVDWDLYHTWQCLSLACRERYPRLEIRPERQLQSSLQEGHWTLDQHALHLERVDHQSGQAERLDLSQAQDWLEELTPQFPATVATAPRPRVPLFA